MLPATRNQHTQRRYKRQVKLKVDLFIRSISDGGTDGLPVDDEVLVGGLLVTDRTDPRGLLLVHLDVECGIKALQVGAGQRPTRDHQAHLP